ncbi:MAG: hypothetical protein CMD61_01660 [Gammaproteobacteria bacterium]|nr:hypothetical protein [Gammaproteobacteria bacterium]|tara:strand:+ start:5258 stop:5557 length:300 start_codon:yes stop_codon:yes gene_type:complete
MIRQLGIGFAYLCIYTTPLQIFFFIWILITVFQTDYGILTLSTKTFLLDKLQFFHDWIYSWFWNDWLNFWYQFPALIMVTIKAVFNTWLGFWILKKLKQ